MRIAQVILDIPTQALDQAYSYLVPDQMQDAQVGCPVLVPFGHRKAVGFVMSLQGEYEVDESLRAKAKPIEAVLGKSFFDESASECARFLSKRYIAPLSSCVRLFTPPGGTPTVRKQNGQWVVCEPATGQVDDRWVRLGPNAQGFKPRKGAVKQEAILAALQMGALRVSELTAEYGNVSSSLKALETRGVVVVEHRRRLRGVPASEGAGEDFVPSAKPRLTQGQAQALEGIRRACDARNGSVVVVDGVTGSGKTEVYLQAIEGVLAQGRTAIVLVPEISLTPQTVARFRGRFGDMVAVLHSRMSAGERFDQWDFIRSGQARVVVGARSALFAPLADVGLIVIDEEHEGSYKQDQAPRYVSRDVAEWKANACGAALVLGSATPSIEALHKVETDSKWSIVRLPERANGRPMPQIKVVDMACEFGKGSRNMFSLALRMALEETLRAGQKAVLLLNQRGFASFVLCRECGFVPECPSCSVSLTFHERGNMLACHHCDHREPAPPLCPKCGSPYLRKFGAGTQRVEAELVSYLETLKGVDAKVIRMDADTTSAKGAHQRLLEEFAASEAAVLLGTQMIAKGLDFDDVTLVGVINADTQLRLPDYRSGERTFDLIEQVAGRAGRADLPGRVIVQTYSPHAVPIRAAARYDRQMFLQDELAKRKMLQYPPFVRLADVRIWGECEEDVRAEGRALSLALKQAIEQAGCRGWTMLPATPCLINRIRGNWRYHITIKAPLDTDISAVLEPVFRSRKANPQVNVAVDVDPASML